MQEKKTAVALEYETGEKAPKVVASGRGYLADKIVEVAKESDVPVHKDAKLQDLCLYWILVSTYHRSCILW